VSGVKFNDADGNGQRGEGEGPLAGFTFYVDYDGNGALDAGEPAAVSADDGSWTIAGINPGTWKVREQAVAGFTCTAPNPCEYDVTLRSGDAQTGKDFGNQPPAQLVLPERITPGAARLIAPTGCASKAFNARVRGSKIARVVFILDGKTVKTLRKPNSGKLFSVRVDPGKLRVGVHRIVAAITFQAGSGTRPKRQTISFQRCARKLQAPRFTG
jgi:hypothetical protein